MPLECKVRFLRTPEPGTPAQGVIELCASLPNESTSPADARAAFYDSDSRPTINLNVALDVSGSMIPFEKMLQVASKTLVETVPTGSTCVRFITFGTDAVEFTKSTLLLNEAVQTQVASKFAHLRLTAAMTNIYEGLELLMDGVDSNLNFLVILSDGHANIGASCATRDLVDVVESNLSNKVVVLTSIGFNRPEYLQMDLLSSLAALTDGNVHTMTNPDTVQEAFGDVVGDLASILFANTRFEARGVSLNIPPAKCGIHIRMGTPRLIPFEFTDSSDKFVDIQSYNVLQKVMDEYRVGFIVPENQETDWEVDEALILDQASRVIKNQANENYEEDLEKLLARIDLSPRKSLDTLASLSAQIHSILNAAISPEQVDQLAFDTMYQRSGIREGGGLSLHASESPQLGRQISRQMSQNPQASVADARRLFSQLTQDPMTD